MRGKVVLITGGGSGIGLGIAKQMGKHGAQIIIGGRRENVLKEACENLAMDGVEAVGFKCDVRKNQDCENLLQQGLAKFGRLDVLVNNAAGNFSTSIEQLSLNGFKTIMDIDLFGTFNMSQACLNELKKTKGVIINISATLYYTAFPFQMAASAAKAAIDVLTRNIGVEWGADYGIRAVSIAPGPIENTTGGPGGRVFGAMMNASGDAKDVRRFVPIGRYGTVEDIANAALFVCSPAGSYVNATTIVVDGGQWHDASRAYLIGKEVVKRASQKEKATHKGGIKKSNL